MDNSAFTASDNWRRFVSPNDAHSTGTSRSAPGRGFRLAAPRGGFKSNAACSLKLPQAARGGLLKLMPDRIIQFDVKSAPGRSKSKSEPGRRSRRSPTQRITVCY